ncbi:hypothetical protein BH09PSE4_BH09PSE4_01120 [soil metagenome]
MFKTPRSAFAATAFAAALVAAAPAIAADAPPVTGLSYSEAAPAPQVPAKTTRYCFGEVSYGAIVRHDVCQTRVGWLRQGVEPLNHLR